jgi:hypothetical protein
MKVKESLRPILSLAIIATFVLIAIASSEDEGVKTSSGINIKFEQIGYFKADNKLRYFTFYVNSSEELRRDSVPQEVIDEIKEHGSNQMNTSGMATASFYYLIKEDAPNITGLDAQTANDIAHERNPIASVWIMPNGQVNFINNPE